ncbi:MAG: PspA/IM30 family protein [Micromonosporaceae bacterium]
MANPFVKAWKYLMALFGSKVDEHADPKVQIQQAIEESQHQHQALVQQAAAVIGNQRQLEMKLSRQLSSVEKLQASARQALTLADRSRAAGDQQKSEEYERAAQAFATELVSAEQGIEDLKGMHDQSLTAAGRARKAVEDNAVMLKQQLAERTKLLNQLEQAKMQEKIAHSLESMSELAAPGNVPSLDEVRDKIERRYASALGRADLAQGSVEGRMIEVERSTLDVAGSSRLDEIRSSMAGEKLEGAPEQPAVESGKAAESGNAAKEPGAAKLDEIRASVAKERNSDSTAG